MQNEQVLVNGDLEEAIASMEARLRELDGEREATARELTQLCALRKDASQPVGTAGRVESSSWTPQRKLALFADLFRGREDIFPVRWVKQGDGRSGWAPCCANEWKAGICGKPRVKCGECPNQAFRATRGNELLAHLQGRHVMGHLPAAGRRHVPAVGDRPRRPLMALRCRGDPGGVP
ncbi:MAG: TOTE conflict system archaeo-eukaryotic primase domain-containing protein [Solirubrobacteraceae bacterium]